MGTRNTAKGAQYEKMIGQAYAAVTDEFYLEGSAICFNVIQDRIHSAVSHIQKRPPNKEQRNKLTICIAKLVQLVKSDAKYSSLLSENSLNDILAWKNERDIIMHELAKHDMSQGKLKNHCSKGIEHMKKLTSSVMKLKKLK